MSLIMRRIPFNALQTGVYSLLSSGQTTPVYDDVPKEAKLPFITFGAFTCKKNGAKSIDISDVSLQIHIWSEYYGKSEVNGIADDIATVLASKRIDLSADNFNVIEQDVDFIEAFEEDEGGYHGVLTLVCKVQNLK